MFVGFGRETVCVELAKGRLDTWVARGELADRVLKIPCNIFEAFEPKCVLVAIGELLGEPKVTAAGSSLCGGRGRPNQARCCRSCCWAGQALSGSSDRARYLEHRFITICELGDWLAVPGVAFSFPKGLRASHTREE